MTTTAPETTTPATPAATAPQPEPEVSFRDAFEFEPDPGTTDAPTPPAAKTTLGAETPADEQPPGERLTWKQKQAERKERQRLKLEEQRGRADQGRALDELAELREKYARLEGAVSARPTNGHAPDLLEVVKEHAKRKGVDIGTALQQVAEQIALDGAPGPMAALEANNATKAELAELRQRIEEREKTDKAREFRFEQERIVQGASSYVEKVFAEDGADFPWLEYVDEDVLKGAIDQIARHAVFDVPHTLAPPDLVERLDEHFSRVYRKIIHQGNGTRPAAGKDPQGTRNPGASSSKPGSDSRTKPRTFSNRHQAATTSRSLDEMTDDELDQAYRAALKEAQSSE